MAKGTLFDPRLAAEVEAFRAGKIRPSATNGLRERLAEVIQLHLDEIQAETSAFCKRQQELCGTEGDTTFSLVSDRRIEELSVARSIVDELDAWTQLKA